jgi:hypothetical protein
MSFSRNITHTVRRRVLLGAASVSILAPATAANLTAQASKGVHVCLGTDNVLRFTTGTRCPQGQRLFRLAEVEDEVGAAKERDDPPNAAVADLKTKVDFLTKRVASLEEATRKGSDPTARSRFEAPFEVVDRDGNPIFVVTDAEYSAARRRGRIHIGRASGGANYSILTHNQGGAVVAGIGEGRDSGAGTMMLADKAGAYRVQLFSEEGLTIRNKTGSPVIELKIGQQGAGQFWLYDATGTPMVKAGTTSPGVGVVETGPRLKCAPEMGTRVGDCIRGRAQ